MKKPNKKIPRVRTPKKPVITKIEKECATKFLQMNTATYIMKDGKEGKWNFVEREKKVVVIVPFNLNHRKLLFTIQPRIPVGKLVINFPAGLIEPKATVLSTARKELMEETGYSIKKVLSVSPLIPRSAGLTNEAHYQVIVEVDEEKKGAQKLERSENIKAFWMTPQAMYKKVKHDPDILIENDAWTFISGLLKNKLSES